VHYGVRPGDITLSDPSNGVPAKVIVVEPTGAETELLVEVGGAKLILAVHGRVDAQPDQMVGLAIASESVHLFDRQSGARLG
jgi:multiple sugar transport system ATP-binding protein